MLVWKDLTEGLTFYDLKPSVWHCVKRLPLSLQRSSHQWVWSRADSTFPGTVLSCAVALLNYWDPGLTGKTRFSRAASRDRLAFWKEAESKLPGKQICLSGREASLWFPRWDHNPTCIMDLFTSGWQDSSPFSHPSPILFPGTNMTDGAVDAFRTLVKPSLRVGRTTMA